MAAVGRSLVKTKENLAVSEHELIKRVAAEVYNVSRAEAWWGSADYTSVLNIYLAYCNLPESVDDAQWPTLAQHITDEQSIRALGLLMNPVEAKTLRIIHWLTQQFSGFGEAKAEGPSGVASGGHAISPAIQKAIGGALTRCLFGKRVVQQKAAPGLIFAFIKNNFDLIKGVLAFCAFAGFSIAEYVNDVNGRQESADCVAFNKRMRHDQAAVCVPFAFLEHCPAELLSQVSPDHTSADYQFAITSVAIAIRVLREWRAGDKLESLLAERTYVYSLLSQLFASADASDKEQLRNLSYTDSPSRRGLSAEQWLPIAKAFGVDPLQVNVWTTSFKEMLQLMQYVDDPWLAAVNGWREPHHEGVQAVRDQIFEAKANQDFILKTTQVEDVITCLKLISGTAQQALLARRIKEKDIYPEAYVAYGKIVLSFDPFALQRHPSTIVIKTREQLDYWLARARVLHSDNPETYLESLSALMQDAFKNSQKTREERAQLLRDSWSSVSECDLKLARRCVMWNAAFLTHGFVLEKLTGAAVAEYAEAGLLQDQWIALLTILKTQPQGYDFAAIVGCISFGGTSFLTRVCELFQERSTAWRDDTPVWQGASVISAILKLDHVKNMHFQGDDFKRLFRMLRTEHWLEVIRDFPTSTIPFDTVIWLVTEMPREHQGEAAVLLLNKYHCKVEFELVKSSVLFPYVRGRLSSETVCRILRSTSDFVAYLRAAFLEGGASSSDDAKPDESSQQSREELYPWIECWVNKHSGLEMGDIQSLIALVPPEKMWSFSNLPNIKIHTSSSPGLDYKFLIMMWHQNGLALEAVLKKLAECQKECAELKDQLAQSQGQVPTAPDEPKKIESGLPHDSDHVPAPSAPDPDDKQLPSGGSSGQDSSVPALSPAVAAANEALVSNDNSGASANSSEAETSGLPVSPTPESKTDPTVDDQRDTSSEDPPGLPPIENANHAADNNDGPPVEAVANRRREGCFGFLRAWMRPAEQPQVNVDAH